MESVRSNLVFDVGLHKGEDTAFYLAKGFSVVAVEADPALAAYCRGRFSQEIQRGKLIIIDRAIVPPAEDGSIPTSVRFFKSSISVCGTIINRWAERDMRGGATFEEIEVPTVKFRDLIQEHGMPYFMKIDVEGVDTYCIEAVGGFAQRPAFISIEAEKEDDNLAEKQVDILEKLGYSKFQITQQKGSHRNQTVCSPAREGAFVPWTFESAASGLFGRELPESRWVDQNIVRQELRKFRRAERFWGTAGLQKTWLGKRIHGVVKRLVNHPLPGWLDLHAQHQSVK